MQARFRVRLCYRICLPSLRTSPSWPTFRRARVFDVRFQGKTVLSKVDVAATAGVRRAVVKEFSRVVDNETLVLELAPITAAPPIRSAIELFEERFERC